MAAMNEIFNEIKKGINENRTVYVQTALRTTVITPKTWSKWIAATGSPPVFVDSENELRMRSGRSSVIISFTKITIR